MRSETSVETSALPDCLREREQWVCWREEQRDGKPTKIPVTPGTGVFASSTDPDTWATFETALECVDTSNADGVGFVFTDNDPIVGVDLDDCRDPESGDVNDAALDIITRLDSYTEISPSGTGYHVLIEGELPDGRNRRGSIELYDTARFFTVTGDHVERTPSRVARRQDALVAIHREYVQDTDSDAETESGPRGTTDQQSAPPETVDLDVDLEDETLLEKARNAANGEKFERLWIGNTAGYESQSEADMALCCLLAFWTGGDRMRMDQLFRRSGLLRKKWDEVHYADGSTYGEKTIERAIATTSEFYEPDAASTRETEDDVQCHSVASSAGQREQTYLAEKNRLLRERVNDLEATLDQKNDRIATLEATVRDLQEALAERESEIEQFSGQGDDGDTVDEGDSTERTVWTRAKRFLADDE